MIAVMAEVTLNQEGKAHYIEIAAAARALLSGSDGFISIERFQSLSDPGKVLSLLRTSYASTARTIAGKRLPTAMRFISEV